MEKKDRGRAQKSGFQRPKVTRRNPPSSSNSWKFRPPDRKEAPAAVEQSSGPSSSIRERSRNDDDALVGTCPDMCPAKERAQRERLRDLAVFERLDGNPARTSPGLAVKKFCRTISTIHVQASDIRPLPVLQNTLKYLMDLMDFPEYPFEVVHDFIFDRTRSIRQDLIMQNIINDQAICMYEDMVKFHIISHKKLARCCGKSDVSSLCYLNMEQLMKCLLSLFDMYDINQRSKSIGKNEAEFYSFYVLLHLGYKIPKMGDSLSFWYSQLALPILQSKEMCFARSLLRYSQMGNYKRFFSTIAAEASDLQLCLLEPFLNEVRGQALSFISYGSYKLQPYPLGHLCKILMIKEAELESLCYECGLETSTDEGGSKFLPAKQTSFRLPKPGFQSYSLFDSEKNYRDQISRDDIKVFAAVSKKPGGEFPNVCRWCESVSSIIALRFPGDAVGVKIASQAASSAPAPAAEAAKATEEEDDLDLFGEETEEEKKAAEVREAAVKASSKKKESGKSSVLMDIKPWDDETDMKKLEEAVRSIEMPGLLWGASKLAPVGYGIKKLQIMLTIVDDLVSVDSLIEEQLTVEPCSEYVQSCDIVAFNKI